LADLLVDYLPANETSGGPVVKTLITTPEGWWRKRPSVERRARTLLGETPPLTGELDPRITGEVRREGYRELAVSFNSGSGDEIFGWLLVPDGAAAGSPAPAILALHSTIEAGAKVTVGIERARPNRDYGLELTRRGYVVLAIDEITAGRRVYGQDYFDTGEFDRRFSRWSAMGKMLHDHRRAIDFLAARAEVDTSRIGVIGHSLGGYNAFFHQAFDARVKAAVSSCGFVAVGSSASPFRFARASWFVHFPALRDYLRSGIVPCDMHEVLSLCAPRPFFNYSARQDHIFPDFWAVSTPLEQVARLYEILGAGDRFVRVYRDGDHDFPPEVRQQAYEFLDRWLKK
ncbi:MAG: dienelactone hydrolase family protein, partial [Candidatus Glassbacteria bacterium]